MQLFLSVLESYPGTLKSNIFHKTCIPFNWNTEITFKIASWVLQQVWVNVQLEPYLFSNTKRHAGNTLIDQFVILIFSLSFSSRSPLLSPLFFLPSPLSFLSWHSSLSLSFYFSLPFSSSLVPFSSFSASPLSSFSASFFTSFSPYFSPFVLLSFSPHFFPLFLDSQYFPFSLSSSLSFLFFVILFFSLSLSTSVPLHFPLFLSSS